MTTPTPPVAGDVPSLLPCPLCACRMRIEPIARDWWRLSGDHDDRCILLNEETDVPQTTEQLDALAADWNRRAALSTAPAGADGWMPIETAPKDKTLLLGYFNSHGNWRTLRGQWLSQDEIDQDWEEPDLAGEGWYETPVEIDDTPNCFWTEPTHWMPLPAAPGAAAAVRSCTCHPDDSPSNPCAKRYALAECKAAEQAAPARDPRDEEAWQALGFLSGLHGCMTIDGDQPMKMAKAIFDHVQAEIKHWREAADTATATLVELAQERAEIARWRLAQDAARTTQQGAAPGTASAPGRLHQRAGDGGGA